MWLWWLVSDTCYSTDPAVEAGASESSHVRSQAVTADVHVFVFEIRLSIKKYQKIAEIFSYPSGVVRGDGILVRGQGAPADDDDVHVLVQKIRCHAVRKEKTKLFSSESSSIPDGQFYRKSSASYRTIAAKFSEMYFGIIFSPEIDETADRRHRLPGGCLELKLVKRSINSVIALSFELGKHDSVFTKIASVRLRLWALILLLFIFFVDH